MNIQGPTVTLNRTLFAGVLVVLVVSGLINFTDRRTIDYLVDELADREALIEEMFGPVEVLEPPPEREEIRT